MSFDQSQADAIALMSTEPICIVTGPPGTGKTTCLKGALAQLRAQGQSVRLAAPTGKAAKRMQEATGEESVTIHRLLAYDPSTNGFHHGAHDPIVADAVIIDEASMVDVALFSALLDAIDETQTRLILVGDANQLPSVGPGAILSDLVRSDLVPCARLTTVHRSAAESWICTSAPRILEGEALDLKARADFAFESCDVALNVPELCARAYEKHRVAGVQILVPQKTGKAGADAINVSLQARFNPHAKGAPQWGHGSNLLRAGDPVIHTQNNYQLGVFNGECGTVVSIDAESLLVQYPDRTLRVRYSKADARALRLAYALTIHKSQGSEWPWVIVVAHSTHSYMLTRQLLYTAITRGKAGVCIVGNEQGIAHALKTKKDSARNTALCDRIRGEL